MRKKRCVGAGASTADHNDDVGRRPFVGCPDADAPTVIAREMGDSAPTTRSADGTANGQQSVAAEQPQRPPPKRRASLAPQTAPLIDDGPPAAPPRPRRASWPAPVPAPETNECKEPSSTRSADLERFVARRAATLRRATPDAQELEEQVRSALDDMVSTERRRTPPPAKKRPSLAAQLFRPRSASKDDADAKLASQLYGGSMTSSRRKQRRVPWNHPDSVFRQRWILAVIIATLYCAVELPVELAFYPGFQVNSFKFWFDICIDLFFVADICVSLKTGFVEDGVVIMDPKRIRAKYCRSGFVVDLIAVLPFDVAMAFAGSGDGNESLVAASTRLGRVARLSRLLRLGRVARLFRYSQHYLGGLHEGHVRILALTFTVFLFAHWDACLLYLSARMDDFDEDRTWVGYLGLKSRTNADQYAWALFKACSHMLCIGYGVVRPLSTIEVLLTTVSMVFGAALFAGIIGSLTAYLASLDGPSARYERLQRDCNVFLEQHGLSPTLRERVRDHLDRSHLRVKRRSCDAAAEARGHGRVDEGTILDALSPLLRSEVCVERCRRVIRASPLLNGTLVRRDIARAVAPVLSPLSVGEGEAVLEKNEPALEMYFVETGCVRLIRDEPVAALEAGSYFGEIPLVFETVMLQPFSAVACEACDLWVLPRDAFERLGLVFPELPRIVRLVARQRLERMGVSLIDISSDADGSDSIRLLEDLFASPEVRMLAQRMLSAESSPALSPALSPRE